jgi:hypothetical protein
MRSVKISRGQVRFVRYVSYERDVRSFQRHGFDGELGEPDDLSDPAAEAASGVHYRLGQFAYYQSGFKEPDWVAFIPVWAFVCACIPVPAFWLLRNRHKRRIRAGHCGVCGYDLRASTGRCPECGSAMEDNA